MTAYPINYEYDNRSGSMFDGMAANAEDARAVISDILTEANGEPAEAPMPRIMSTEAGQKSHKREDIEAWWADEIAEGWVTPIQIYGGWVAQVEYWGCD